MKRVHARTAILVAVVAGLVGNGVSAAKRQRTPTAILPQEELFVQQNGLRVALHLPERTLHVGQDPRFTLVFKNEGAGVLYLSPYVGSTLRITRIDGTPATPIVSGIAERIAPPRVRPKDLVALDRGRSAVRPVSPAHYDRDVYRAYAEHGSTKDAGWGLLLPPGDYVARFVYINAPDYGGSYDPYEIPRGIWEGRIEAEPVRFTVVAPSAGQVAREMQRLGGPARPTLSLLPLLPLSATQLIDEFIARPGSRLHVVRVARMLGERMAPLLLEALDSIPPGERAETLYSDEFASLLCDQADCASLHVLTDALASSRGDVLSSVRPVFEKVAPQCPEVRERLRSVVQDSTAPPYARSNAAALLGTFGNPADVSLLVEALERVPSGKSDPIPRGAATGLALIGGQSATEALRRALADDRRNLQVGPEAVSRLAAIGGPDTAEPLLGALSSRNPAIVVSALGALYSVRSAAAVPRLLELLEDTNPTIRVYAAKAIRATGAVHARTSMRAAVGDSDDTVRMEALFYLAEHGDSSDLELFVSQLDSRNQYVRDAARAGIARFGTAATFRPVRKLLDVPSRGIQTSAETTLGFLAFVETSPPWTAKRWDEWYAPHRDTPRAQWAQEAVDGLRQSGLDDLRWKLSAFSYLADQGAATYQKDFERAATSRDPLVRAEAARAIARVDPGRAAMLLIREFDGRWFNGCREANRALNELARQQRTFDCTDPAERRRAREEWARESFRF